MPDQDTPGVRIVKVRAEWETYHEIEVPADAPQIESLDDLLEYEDIDSSNASLSDWEIRDLGPSHSPSEAS